MICQNCRTELPVNAHFCMNCGQPVQSSTASDQERYSRLAASAPPVLVEKVRAAAWLTGERRMVTALYLDIVDSTGLNHRLGGETWNKLLNRAFDLYSSVIYRYEGTLAQLQHDELLAFFGAPVTHEDDPFRAVRTALDLLEAIRQFDQMVQQEYQEHFLIRISLSTGPVTIGPMGNDLRYEYSALGGTLSHIASIEATKLPMTVMVTEETQRFIAPFFYCTDLGMLEPTGVDHPVHIFKVEGPKNKSSGPRRLEGLYSPIVGRQPELQNLHKLCQVVEAGLGQVVVLMGEPGLGKTRLITEWKASCQDSSQQSSPRWVEGRCLSYGQKIAYHLILSLLRGIIGVSETAGESETRAALCNLIETLWEENGLRPKAEAMLDVYPYLASALSINLEGDTQEQLSLLEPHALQTQSLAALRKLLVTLTAQQPVVVVLEDIHWADSASVDILTQLLPLASTERILFCLVLRPEREAQSWRLVSAARETLGDRLVEIMLNPLSTTESYKLISNLLQIEALPIRVRDLILKRSEGNPLFMEEVIRMLIDRGAIYRENEAWYTTDHINELEIPDNLQGLLLARIDRLSNEVKHTLRVAAVIGKQFSVKVLGHVLAKEEQVKVLNHLGQLETAGLVRVAQVTPDLEYIFRHTLVQDAIVASLLDTDQQRLHQEVGEALEVLNGDHIDDLAAVLSDHFDKARDAPRALKYHRIAAGRAASAYANQEAENHYRRAIELSTEDGLRADLYAELGDTLYSQSKYAEAEQTWQNAIQIYRDLKNSDRAARLQARCARSTWFAGDTPRGLRLCLEGLVSAANAPESPGVASLIHEAARASHFNGKKEDASRLCRQALDMAERLGSLDVQADSLATLAILEDTSPEEALPALRKAVALAESAGLLQIAARALINLGNAVQFELNDPRAARDHFLHAVELVRKRGALSELIIPLVSAAAITLEMGELRQAEQYLAELKAIQPALPDPSTMQIGINALQASIFELQGRHSELLSLIRANIVDAHTRGDLQNTIISSEVLILALIELDHLQGVMDWSEAEQALDDLIKTPISNSLHRIRSFSLACMLKARQKQFSAARQFLEQARLAASESESPWHETMLLRAEYELYIAESRRSNALQVFDSLAKYRETLGPFRWARILTLRAEVLMDHPEPDDLEQARALLIEARTIFEGIDSRFYFDYASQMLTAARAQAHTLAKVHKYVSQELKLAGLLQTGFLPQEPPQLPDWQVAAAIIPARTTTGDFYDFIPLPGGKLAIVIADVADKGIGAALFMTSARTLLRAYAEQYPELPTIILQAVNRRFTQDTQGGLFITMFYGVLDPSTGQLGYCNAGHNPPFVLQADGSRQELKRTGFPLGIFEDAAWTSDSIQIESGGLLVLYTDGVTEALNSREEKFETSRLFQVATSSFTGKGTSAQQMHAAILGAVQEFSAGTQQGDDITLVVLSRA